MYKKFISAFQMLDILFQAIYSLILPIGLGALISYLLTRYAQVGKWIWAVLLTLGTFIGLFSMIKYVLTAIKNFEQLEKERADTEAEKIAKEERHKKLSDELTKNESEGET